MKVLWFEVTVPSAYFSGGAPIGGWQDSLERIVRHSPEIELTIAFMSDRHHEVRTIAGVTYVPIDSTSSCYERYFRHKWDIFVERLLPTAKTIIEKYKPDLIHVFGTEWPFGQIASVTDVPVVIHIMGAIIPYMNSDYPPGYSRLDIFKQHLCNPKRLYFSVKNSKDGVNRRDWEYKTWGLVSNYMGRTQWDKSLSSVLHPGRRYFHVEEALRDVFNADGKKWNLSAGTRLKLLSIGCKSLLKGPDIMLKVARILKDLGIDFEWNVAGVMNKDVKKLVEHKEHCHFEDCNVHILGYRGPDELVDLLCNCTMYVHTAYIENSPNSICEAQCLGVPVVSTNVGGIASLVRNDVDGVLVASNDPWQMADAILQLFKDKDRMVRYSENSRQFALSRHDDENIRKQLLNCYHTLINN